MNRQEIAEILEGDLHPGPWRIDTLRDGLSKEAFIAQCGDLRNSTSSDGNGAGA
jgi:hypothetical protein